MRCEKKKFDKRTAQTVLNQAKRQGKKYRHEARIYFCEECSLWHLTSMEEYSEPEKVDLIFKDKWLKLMENGQSLFVNNFV